MKRTGSDHKPRAELSGRTGIEAVIYDHWTPEFFIPGGYREERSGSGWCLYADPLVVRVQMDIEDPWARKRLCAGLLAVYDRLTSFWESSPRGLLEIHLKSDAGGGQSRSGLCCPHCIPSRRRLHLEPSSSLGHELSHVFAYAANPQRDKLLDEGAATVLNQRDTRLFIDWKASREADHVDLDALFALDTEFPLWSCQYVAGSFVAFVLRTWGRKAFLALFRTPGRKAETIRYSLPVTWADLVRDWRSDLRRIHHVAPQLETIAAKARHAPVPEFLRDLAYVESIIGARAELRLHRLRALLRVGDHDGAAKVGQQLLAEVDERSDCPATLAAYFGTMARLERAGGRESSAICFERKSAQIRTATAVGQLLRSAP